MSSSCIHFFWLAWINLLLEVVVLAVVRSGRGCDPRPIVSTYHLHHWSVVTCVNWQRYIRAHQALLLTIIIIHEKKRSFHSILLCCCCLLTSDSSRSSFNSFSASTQLSDATRRSTVSRVVPQVEFSLAQGLYSSCSKSAGRCAIQRTCCVHDGINGLLLMMALLRLTKVNRFMVFKKEKENDGKIMLYTQDEIPWFDCMGFLYPQFHSHTHSSAPTHTEDVWRQAVAMHAFWLDENEAGIFSFLLGLSKF